MNSKHVHNVHNVHSDGDDMGMDESRGYCLEMICADFLAGAHAEGRSPVVAPQGAPGCDDRMDSIICHSTGNGFLTIELWWAAEGRSAARPFCCHGGTTEIRNIAPSPSLH
jgi:hypothetical protein